MKYMPLACAENNYMIKGYLNKHQQGKNIKAEHENTM